MAGIPRRRVRTPKAQQWHHILSFLQPAEATSFVRTMSGKIKFLALDQQATEEMFSNRLRIGGFHQNTACIQSLPRNHAEFLLAIYANMLPEYYAAHPNEWMSLHPTQKQLMIAYMHSFENQMLIDRVAKNKFPTITFPAILQHFSLLSAMNLLLFRSLAWVFVPDRIIYPIIGALSVVFIGSQLYGHYYGHKKLRTFFNGHIMKEQWRQAARSKPLNRQDLLGDLDILSSNLYLTYLCDRKNKALSEGLYDIMQDNFDCTQLMHLTTAEGIQNLTQIANIQCSYNMLYKHITPLFDDGASSILIERFLAHLSPLRFDPLGSFCHATEVKVCELPWEFFKKNTLGLYFGALTFLFCIATLIGLTTSSNDLQNYGLSMALSLSVISLLVTRVYFMDFSEKRQYKSLHAATQFSMPHHQFGAKARKIIQRYELDRPVHTGPSTEPSNKIAYALCCRRRLYSLNHGELEPLLG